MEIQVEKFEVMSVGALCREEPWHISKVEFEQGKLVTHIYVEIRKGVPFHTKVRL